MRLMVFYCNEKSGTHWMWLMVFNCNVKCRTQVWEAEP